METVKKNYLRDVVGKKAKLWISLYLLVFPTVGSLLVFNYYPNFDAIVMSFFRWEPPSVVDFIGFDNFRQAFSDVQFQNSFKLVGILMVANLIKLWPGIFAAIALHRIASSKWRYRYQVFFVVPMVVPGMVWLLIWKSFYDPDFGLFNKFLNATGGMAILRWLDEVMPQIASSLQPVLQNGINPVFGNVWSLLYLGILLFCMSLWRTPPDTRKIGMAWVIGLTVFIVVGAGVGLFATVSGLGISLLVTIGLLIPAARFIGKSWVGWAILILFGLLVFMDSIWRLPLYFIAAFAIYEYFFSKTDFHLSAPRLRWASVGLIAVGCFFVFFGLIWTEPTEQFLRGNPAWLGNENLVIPAILFWGFPWVGTVGVLIYLSGLQNISEDVYEAAELDGVSPMGMIFRIELPLIMTQVRINIIFLTINTLVAYEMFLILLGPDGGPGGKGTVPGLYMFSTAFSDGRFGYACALGMVLFVIILVLTVIYQKYVKVDK